MNPLVIVGGVTVLFVLVILYYSILVVNEGEMIIVESMGKFSEIKGPGLNFLLPFIQRPHNVLWNRRIEQRQPRGGTVVVNDVFYDYRIRTANVAFDIPPVECYTKEKITVQVNVIVYYNITNLERAVYQVSDLYAGIESKVETLLINMVHVMSIDDITNQSVMQEMNRLLSGEKWQEEWGIKINRFDVQQVVLPQNLTNATLNAVTERRRLEAEKWAHESNRVKQFAEIDTREEIAEKNRRAELAQAQFSLDRLKLENEYQNEKLRKNTEVEVSAESTKLSMKLEHKKQMYQIQKEAGFTEQYYIERKRSKSVEKIYSQALQGQNKTMILPLEALMNGQNQLLLSRGLSGINPHRANTYSIQWVVNKKYSINSLFIKGPRSASHFESRSTSH